MFFFVLITSLLFGKDRSTDEKLVTLTGTVIDAQSRKTIPFATVYIPNKGGAYTDSLGKFVLAVDNLTAKDTMIISSIGYETAYIPIFHSNLNLTIPLTHKVYIGDTLVISDKAAMEIIAKALEKIPDNYPTEQFQYDAFYRQTHFEDGHWCRLIEALVDVYDDGYAPYHGSNLQEYIRVNDLRRSEVTEQNGYKHGDHLVDLLLENFVRYQGGKFTNLPTIDKYDFEFDSTSSPLLYVIRYSNRHLHEAKSETGIIDINPVTFAINRITEHSFPNPAYKPPITQPQDDWIFKEGNIEMIFANYDGTMNLSEIHQHYKHDIFNYQVYSVDHVVEEYFDLWVDKVNNNPGDIGKGFSKQGNLYTQHYTYRAGAWDKNEMVSKHPLTEEVKKGLEKYESLEEQFKKNN